MQVDICILKDILLVQVDIVVTGIRTLPNESSIELNAYSRAYQNLTFGPDPCAHQTKDM